MTLFSKFTKHGNNEKTIHPWSQRKLNGSNAALPRFGHGATMVDSQYLLVFGGYHKGNTKKNLFLIDTSNKYTSSFKHIKNQFLLRHVICYVNTSYRRYSFSKEFHSYYLH